MEFLSDTDDDVTSSPLATQYEYAVTAPAPPVYAVSSEEGGDSVKVAGMKSLWDLVPSDMEAPEYKNYDELQAEDSYEQSSSEGTKVLFLTKAEVLSQPSNVLWHFVKRGIRSPMRPPDATTIERAVVCLQASIVGLYDLPVCYGVLQYRVDDTALNKPRPPHRLRGTVYVTRTGSRVSCIYPGKDDRYVEKEQRRLWEVLFTRIEAITKNGTYDTDRVAFTDVCILPAAKLDQYAQTHGYVRTGDGYTKRCGAVV